MTSDIFVRKRDGSKEIFNPDKIHTVLFWATDGLHNVSVSQIESKANLQIITGVTTREIHDILIQSAHELISEDTPNYQYVAARLKLFQLRKDVFGSFDPDTLYNVVSKNVKDGFYTQELLKWYTPDEFAEMDKFIRHDRDFNYAYAGAVQFVSKYLIQDRTDDVKRETPQIANMLIAATLFNKYHRSIRMRYVREFYNALSTFDFSLPTPIMGGVRSPTKQFSSCVLIEAGDSLNSINRVAEATVNYASKRAGIGINGSKIRALGAKIRGGEATHTGITPFFRYWQSALKSCSQGGIRGASASLTFPWWHYEVQTAMVLKNNKGTDDDRVRKLDYVISRNQLLFERYVNKDKITLFSPHDVPDLMEAFERGDNDEFKRLYEKYERKTSIKKKTISAEDWFEQFHTERKETSRLYYFNIDHVNSHGAFDPSIKPCKQTNLCVEITLPCEELGKTHVETHMVNLDDMNEFVSSVTARGGKVLRIDPKKDSASSEQQFEFDVEQNDGRIQLCTLGAINLGNMKTPEDLAKPVDLLVRALNELLDYQDYPMIEAYLSTMEHRPLGIGVSNLAYWVAKNGFRYGEDDALVAWDEMMESFQYYLIKSSMELAKERGAPCERFSDTKYSKGIMPIHTYAKPVDELVNRKLTHDWEALSKDVQKYGMLNSTLSAQMPVESSSLIINATNGIEMPKELVSEKENSGTIVKQVVPGIHRLKNKYDLLWQQESCLGYIKMVAVMQKYFDQSISANTFFNPKNYPQFNDAGDIEDYKIPMAEMLKIDFLSYRWGIKTGYYCHVFLDGDDNNDEEACAGGACSV